MYIATIVIKILDKVDPRHEVVDLVLFDGAKNVQNAGIIVNGYSPRILCIHGGMHLAGLFFTDISKLTQIKVSSQRVVHSKYLLIIFSDTALVNRTYCMQDVQCVGFGHPSRAGSNF